MLALEVPEGSLAGLVAWYCVIHVPRELHREVFAGFALALAPGGYLLAGFQAGDDTLHRAEAYGHQIDLDFRRLRPGRVAEELAQAGLGKRVSRGSGRRPGPHRSSATWRSGCGRCRRQGPLAAAAVDEGQGEVLGPVAGRHRGEGGVAQAGVGAGANARAGRAVAARAGRPPPGRQRLEGNGKPAKRRATASYHVRVTGFAGEAPLPRPPDGPARGRRGERGQEGGAAPGRPGRPEGGLGFRSGRCARGPATRRRSSSPGSWRRRASRRSRRSSRSCRRRPP